MFLTIFTPTYNRSTLLHRVYESLVKQDNKDFEWIIVNDGSADNTDEVVASFIKEGKISIQYFKQANSGKHVAVNKGLENAKGALFFILDSDDELTSDAVSSVKAEWDVLNTTENIDLFGGLVFNKMYNNEGLIGTPLKDKYLDVSIIDYRFRMKIVGDKLEVFKTNLIKNYLFPINGEKFCPEALVWNRIGADRKFRFVNKAIYLVEYLEGGLSSSIVKIRKQSPQNSATYYSELSKYNIPFPEKIKATINFWRFAIYDKKTNFGKKMMAVNPLYSLIGLPLGLFYAFVERSK